MFRTSGITRRGPNATITFPYQSLIIQLFVLGVAPYLLSYAFMQVFRGGLCQTVSHGLQHNGVVIIPFFFKVLQLILNAKSRGHGKGTQIVGPLWMNERSEEHTSELQ